ncbi:MAG: 4Fe-4S dicluster domain-containing protein [Gemmataceae bacterium]|nr:4Fe-4S dicluster domain-containing protein [Gemmataceae bacterium]
MTPGREFPGYTNVFENAGEAIPDDAGRPHAELSRRAFLALGAAGLAAAAGCRRPELHILPYSAVPDDQVGSVVPGKPAFYATCLPRPGGALPVLVESHEGRPTKIEGHPRHPCSRGRTDAFAQATIYDLYSPDRVMADRAPGVVRNGVSRSWDEFDAFARAEADRLLKEKGKGFAVLSEEMNSPAVRLIRAHMTAAMPEATWHTYEPVDFTEVRKGAELAFGAKLVARYNLDKADRILALDSDFLGLDPDQIHHSVGWAARRSPDGPMSRLYVAESTPTVTGTMADHRLRLASSQVGVLLTAAAKELAARIKPPLPQLGTVATPGVNEVWAKAVAKDLADHPGKAVVLVGYRQPAWVHALGHAVNAALDAMNAGVVELRDAPPEAADKTIADLVKSMEAGAVSTLLVVGGNPVLNAPGDRYPNPEQIIARRTWDFDTALQKVPHKLRLGLYHDQTSEACDWHLPLAHSLEGWGDAEAADGSLCCVQPLIAPLRDGRTALEVLALLTQFAFEADTKPTASHLIAKTKAYELVRRAFADRSGIPSTDPGFALAFDRYKQQGYLPADQDKTGRKPKPAAELKVDAAKIAAEVGKVQLPPVPSHDALELVFVPDNTLYDGRYARNPWLQELPDPITKLVWDNAALVSPATAAAFKVTTGDVIRLSIRGTSIELPAFVLPGQADWSVALPFGQPGAMPIRHVPDGGGFDVFPLRRSDAMHTAGGGTLEPAGRRYDLAVTQEHGTIPEGREIVHEFTAGEYHKHHHDHPDHGPPIGLPPGGLPTEEELKKGFQGGYGNPQQGPAPALQKQDRFPLDLARPELLDSQFQWGMVIDLNACTGCSACVVACQSENNIPVVGKHEVLRNRELHWLRIDRYFTTSGDDTRIVSQPVACVHCESAPCEQVCPVNAAVHSPEGLNLQVYNRCIGTRYCANACPYKVRRFNWFDFNKRGLDELRTPTPFAAGGASLTHNLTPETLKMGKNPDVSVRMRGVMEKCTYCVQRVERAKYGAKIAAAEVAQGRTVIPTDDAFKPDGPPSAYRKPADPRAAGYDLDRHGRVIVPDGGVITACQQSCPTGAIVFGNVLDPNSRVSKLKEREAEYLLLGELNTKPRTSYLPRVRNPNPELVG